MIKGIYAAASGMLPRIQKQETISNNLANVNTPGYKRESVFLKQLNSAQARNFKAESEWQIPMTDEIYTDFSRGSLEFTGDDLHVAIDGDGFFTIQTPKGEAYTRNGNFHLDVNGTLLNCDGLPVLSDSGEIQAEGGGDIHIGVDGAITINGEEYGKLQIVDFEKPYQLNKISAGLYAPKPGTNQEDIEYAYVRQGYLEKANVDVIQEMVDMIASYRNFESDQKAIKILDETLGKTVNEIGRIK